MVTYSSKGMGNMNRLKFLREEKKLSLKDVADVLGISEKSYSNIENGKTRLKMDIMIKLSDYYSINTDYLVCRTDIREPYKKSTLNQNKNDLK